MIAIVLVKNEGLSQGSAGADGEEWVNLRGVQEVVLTKDRKRDIWIDPR